jgi:hypothetical protein
MGTFKTFMDQKGITAKQVATTSKRIEANDETSRTLLVKRAGKRRDKEAVTKKYADLGIDKPKQMGRGVSEKQVEAAFADVALARKARSKILRAVNVILAKKGQPVADMKMIFEGTTARPGKKPVVAKKNN